MAEDDKDEELEAGRMPLLDHLIELRNRLLWSFGAIRSEERRVGKECRL